uniref:Uncharacterized protein n=1 Tax=Romanomermis culicivorax TaxID=13658 RepID=A0A915JUK9_ROMCU
MTWSCCFHVDRRRILVDGCSHSGVTVKVTSQKLHLNKMMEVVEHNRPMMRMRLRLIDTFHHLAKVIKNFFAILSVPFFALKCHDALFYAVLSFSGRNSISYLRKKKKKQRLST